MRPTITYCFAVVEGIPTIDWKFNCVFFLVRLEPRIIAVSASGDQMQHSLTATAISPLFFYSKSLAGCYSKDSSTYADSHYVQ